VCLGYSKGFGPNPPKHGKQFSKKLLSVCIPLIFLVRLRTSQIPSNRLSARTGASQLNFLGFTHICGQGWKSGKFFVLRKTIGTRLLAKLKQVKAALRRRMHQALAEVGKWLRSVIQGYFNYHAVPGNLCQSPELRVRGTQALAPGHPTPQPEEPEYVGAFRAYRGSVAPGTQDSSSPYPFALRR
jgi:hypothetical protein